MLGRFVGTARGTLDGLDEGKLVGWLVGREDVGLKVDGNLVGRPEGLVDGIEVGRDVGYLVGLPEGLAIGMRDG